MLINKVMLLASKFSMSLNQRKPFYIDHPKNRELLLAKPLAFPKRHCRMINIQNSGSDAP